MIKQGLLYTKEHEWVRIEGDTATVGITDHAQDMLGEVTFVELPAVGKTVKQGGELAVIESSKAASDVYSPVAGEVVEVNDPLADAPLPINEDPYGDGWLCKLHVTGKPAGLMDAAQYEEYLKGL